MTRFVQKIKFSHAHFDGALSYDPYCFLNYYLSPRANGKGEIGNIWLRAPKLLKNAYQFLAHFSLGKDAIVRTFVRPSVRPSVTGITLHRNNVLISF